MCQQDRVDPGRLDAGQREIGLQPTTPLFEATPSRVDQDSATTATH